MDRYPTPPLPDEEEAKDLSSNKLTEIVLELRDSLLAMNYQKANGVTKGAAILPPPPPPDTDAEDQPTANLQ